MKQYKNLLLYVLIVVVAVTSGRFLVLEARAKSASDPKSFSTCDEPQPNDPSGTE